MQPFVDEDCFYRLPFDVVQIIFRHIPVHEALQLVLSTSLTPSKHGNNGNTGNTGNTGFVTQLDHTVVKLSKMNDIIDMYPNARSLHVQIDEYTHKHAYNWTFVKYIQELRLSLSCNLPSSSASAASSIVATHIAMHISQNRSLIKLNLAYMLMGNKATKILCTALCESTVTKVQELNLSFNGIGPGGAEAIAALCAIKASVTECNVRGNNLDATSATLLAKVTREKRIMLFGIKHHQTKADFQDQLLGPVDAILIASDLSVSSSLTSVR